MSRRILLLASVAFVLAFAGCKHKCFKKDCCGPAPSPLPPGSGNSILLPPAGVPTTPGPGSQFPPPSSLTPPPATLPPSGYTPAPKGSPDVLFPDPLPGNSSSRPVQPNTRGYLGAPTRPQTAEPPKVSTSPAGVPGFAKVKDGLFAGGRPTIDGFDALKKAGIRTVIYLHGAGANVSAVKDLASTRSLNFIGIEVTPESLAEASKEFDRAAADKINRPAYVFADDGTRAGAIWYLHFRLADSLADDVAHLRAKALGLTDQGDEGKAFALAIQRVLETR